MTKLAIFDFDWTVVNENSDVWIFKVLSSHNLYKELKRRRGSTQWTQLMDELVVSLMTKEGRSLKEMEEALNTIPIHEDMINLIEDLHSKGYKLYVVSDANTMFIRSILNARKLLPYFTEIISNPGIVSDGILRITPIHSNHGCGRCPSNICKGKIVSEILQHERATSAFYFGDGMNDFCPMTVMRDFDVFFVREGFGLANMLEEMGLHPKVSSAKDSGGKFGSEIISLGNHAQPKSGGSLKEKSSSVIPKIIWWDLSSLRRQVTEQLRLMDED